MSRSKRLMECVTLPGHLCASYRNFSLAHTRWQFARLRLAEDAWPRRHR
jgi:formylglycine-generating enzyme required for sulfatase activity